MVPALWISKTGLDAQQTNISVASNNLANASTVGFKKGRAIFEDLLYQNVHQPGGRSSADTTLPSGLMLGAGTKVVATQKSFTQGDVQTTDNALDVMINGRGFFEVQMPDGTTSYTRNGQFALNSEGTIVTSGAGYPILPEIQVPEGAKSITVSGDGQVSVTLTGDAEPQVVGQLTVTGVPPTCNASSPKEESLDCWELAFLLALVDSISCTVMRSPTRFALMSE